MLVERGNDLETLRTVMYLVKYSPQEIAFMPGAVPPIEHESGDEIGNQTAGYRRYLVRQVKDRMSRQPAFPADAGQQYHAQLKAIHDKHTERPGSYARQDPARNGSFQDKTEYENGKNNGQHES